jgi:hypothetical protein
MSSGGGFVPILPTLNTDHVLYCNDDPIGLPTGSLVISMFLDGEWCAPPEHIVAGEYLIIFSTPNR